MLSATTKRVEKPLETGEYTATFSSMRDGRTPADTILTFKDVNTGRAINAYVNNTRVIFQDDNGVDYTSEDFLFLGLKKQLKMYGDNVSPLDVLHACAETPVTLWVVADEYVNVYSTKPKEFDSADLGL